MLFNGNTQELHYVYTYTILPPLHRNRRIGFKKIIVAHRNNLKWHIMAQNILQLFGINLIYLNFRWDHYFRRNRHYCKGNQNRKSLVFPKSEQIIIFCEANISNIFSGNGTFRCVYAVNARFSVQRRKYISLDRGSANFKVDLDTAKFRNNCDGSKTLIDIWTSWLFRNFAMSDQAQKRKSMQDWPLPYSLNGYVGLFYKFVGKRKKMTQLTLVTYPFPYVDAPLRCFHITHIQRPHYKRHFLSQCFLVTSQKELSWTIIIFLLQLSISTFKAVVNFKKIQMIW